jgi:hypothetical protein
LRNADQSTENAEWWWWIPPTLKNNIKQEKLIQIFLNQKQKMSTVI